jgi:D-glycero-alpha-D-manno-heptose 1-phosphate guanylyltransferase
MREAIVLAGGFGTRLRGMVPDLPKPMAPVGGRPFLEILLEQLVQNGFDRAVLSLGHMAQTISGHFGNHYMGLTIDYTVESQPLGTGGAVRLAMSKCEADHVFVFNGDTFLDVNANAIDQRWEERRRPLIVACEVPDALRYGRLVVAGGQVTGFQEKGMPGPGLINAGSYVFNRGQLDGFALNEPFSLETDYLMQAVSTTEIDVFVTDGRFIDIGVPEDYLRAQSIFASR